MEPISSTKTMLEILFKKEVFDLLIAARLRYGQFANYHIRFGLTEEDIYYKCNQKRSRSHPFNCSSARKWRVKLFNVMDRRLLTQKEVLGTAHGIKMFAKWIPKTELFLRRTRTRKREEEV